MGGRKKGVAQSGAERHLLGAALAKCAMIKGIWSIAD